MAKDEAPCLTVAANGGADGAGIEDGAQAFDGGSMHHFNNQRRVVLIRSPALFALDCDSPFTIDHAGCPGEIGGMHGLRLLQPWVMLRILIDCLRTSNGQLNGAASFGR